MAPKLDLRDKKILYELDRNSRISHTRLAKKLKTSKEVIFHRINNLLNRKIILKCQAVTATYRFSYMFYKIYLRLHDVSKKDVKDLFDYLEKQDVVKYLANCRGRWDLMIGIWAESIEAFFIAHDFICNKISILIQEKELSVSRKTIQYNRRYLYHDDISPVEFTFGEDEPLVKVNAEDQKILDILTANSRTKVSEIAEITGLSRDKVSYRIAKLEQEKIINGYKCQFNSELLGYVTCKAFVFYKNITDARRTKFIEYCKLLPNCINIVVPFARWDLEIMFEVESFEQFYKIMDDVKNEFRDIIKFYDGTLIYSEPKQVLFK